MNDLDSIRTTVKTGEETFISDNKNLDYKIIDFWKWNLSDLVDNSTRGKLAEFIVGMALDLTRKSYRMEWDDYDLLYQNKLKIEVKSAAYIQSWKQKRHSNISFGIRQTRSRDNSTGQYGIECRPAHVYVFCLLKNKDQQSLNPLDLSQWEFYVVPTRVINSEFGGQKTVSLSRIQQLVQPLMFSDIQGTIESMEI